MIRKAFTMLELVFVMVIMGIVASIGAEIIANLYENYIKTRAINRLQSQTELALDQIAKRLQYRIKDSARAIDISNPASPVYTPLSDANASFTILEWIGISNESFLEGWSGFIDLNSNDTNATARTLKTSGSDLNTTNNIIKALTYDDVSLDKSTASNKVPALIFKGKSHYDVNEYFDTSIDNHTLKITGNNSDLFTIPLDDNVSNNEIFEQYWLSHSAFAIVPNGTVNDFNLTLHYNYQPWENEDYNSTTGVTIIEHASTFRFTQIGETIRVKLCIHDNNQSGDYDFSFCKERVIY